MRINGKGTHDRRHVVLHLFHNTLAVEKIVTKEWLAAKVAANPQYVIGRALVAIFNYQTEEEQSANYTRLDNGVGFSANDARLGCIGAKYFMKHGTLSDGLIKGWLKRDKFGMPRICKYAKQLNNISNDRLQKR